jgi:hypothetical protein
MRTQIRRQLHPLEHHPSFRAAIEAAPPLAELSLELTSEAKSREGWRQWNETDLVSSLAIAVGDLADGFAAPPDSQRRARAHRRAWGAVRDLDRKITAIGRRRLASPALVRKAQRAIDRADVLIGALVGA